MTTIYGGSNYPTGYDAFAPALVDTVDEVVADHPNTALEACVNIETKLGIDGDPVTGLGGVCFEATGKAANPGAPGVPTIWIDNTPGTHFQLRYTDELGVDYRVMGPTGVTGPEGPTGHTGPSGYVGSDGATGPTGPRGMTGPSGARGHTGVTGTNGSIAGFDVLEYAVLPIEWAEDGASAPASPVLYSHGTNGRVRVRKFSGTANQDVIFNWTVPDDCKASSGLKYKVRGIVTEATLPTSGEGVNFWLSGYSCGQGDHCDDSFGTPIAAGVADLFGSGCTGSDYYVTSFSNTVTITNLAAGEEAVLHFVRGATGATDTYAQFIGVSEVVLQWTRTYVLG